MGFVDGFDLAMETPEQKRAKEIKDNPFGETAYLQQIQQAATGQGPSAAQIQARQNMAQAMAQSRAMAAANRGINPALAARLGAQSSAQMAQSGATEAAKLRAQEQLGALGEWGQQIGGQRQAASAENVARITGQYAKDIEHTKANTALAGGLLGGLGGMLSGGLFAQGGEIPESQLNLKPTYDNQACYACGGPVPHMAMGGSMPMMMMPGESGMGTSVEPQKSKLGGALSSMGKYLQQSASQGSSNPQAIIQGALGYACGGRVNMVQGGQVPGQATVQGDNYANDIVPAMLSPKEIVLPRSVTMGNEPGEKAKAFVDAIKRKHAEGKK